MSARIIHAAATTTTALTLASLTACARPSAAGGHADAPTACADSFDAGAVTAVLERQREAWNAGDIEGFLAGYERSEALLFTSGAQVRQGFAVTRDRFRARYGESRETMGTLRFEILDVRGLGACADAAIVLGRWGLTETPEAGSGVFSVILERHGEAWEIVHDHTSADPPEPPPAEPSPAQ